MKGVRGIVFVGLFLLFREEDMRVVDLKILKSYLLRVRAREVVVMCSLQHTAEVIGEDPIGEIHRTIEVAFLQATTSKGISHTPIRPRK